MRRGRTTPRGPQAYALPALPPRGLDAKLAWLNGAHMALEEVVRNPKAARGLLERVRFERQRAMDDVDQRAAFRTRNAEVGNGGR